MSQYAVIAPSTHAPTDDELQKVIATINIPACPAIVAQAMAEVKELIEKQLTNVGLRMKKQGQRTLWRSGDWVFRWPGLASQVWPATVSFLLQSSWSGENITFAFQTAASAFSAFPANGRFSKPRLTGMGSIPASAQIIHVNPTLRGLPQRSTLGTRQSRKSNTP